MASTTYEPLNPWRSSKSIIQTNSDRAGTDVCTGYHISMVRNAGQLPQPFWLGADRGSGSRGAARCAARA